MMKRLLLLACAASLMLAGGAHAQSVTQDGVTYTVNADGQTVSVTGSSPYITTLNVLATVNINGTDYPVTAIGSYAFHNCTALQSVTLPEGLQSIGSATFYNCDALQSVTLPEGLQSIGSDAFRACTALRSITLPQGLQTICNFAFDDCTSLASVTLPEGLQSIGYFAFDDCPLAEVYCHAATPPAIEIITFENDTYQEATLHLPSDVTDAYRTAQGWKQFQHIVGDLPPVSIGSVAADASLATYANGTIAAPAPAAITVHAQSGAVVRHAAHCTSLSLEALPSGTYIICVAQGGQRQVMKVAR